MHAYVHTRPCVSTRPKTIPTATPPPSPRSRLAVGRPAAAAAAAVRIAQCLLLYFVFVQGSYGFISCMHQLFSVIYYLFLFLLLPCSSIFYFLSVIIRDRLIFIVHYFPFII